MKLYSGPLSLFTAKVRVALDEKGLDYQRIEVGWSLAQRYEPHHPDVVALNPKREVPVIVDGDCVIYDSTQIFEYLEDRHPEPPLYPRDVAERARCRRLEAAADEILFRPVWALIEEAFYPAGGSGRDTLRAEEAKAELARLYRRLDAELRGREYLCGAFSVADIGSFVFLNAASTLGAPPADDCANLKVWLSRCAARPAVRHELETTQAFLQTLFAPAAPDAGAPSTANRSSPSPTPVR